MPISDYAFTELNDGSGRGSITESTGQAVRVFKIAWTDLPAFLAALKGGWVRISGNTWQYNTPDEHPEFNFHCLDVDFEPLGIPSFDSGSKVSSWEYAKVTATYRPLAFDPSTGNPDELVEEEFDISTEIIPLKAGTLKTAGGTTVDQMKSYVLPIIAYDVVMQRVPNLPFGGLGGLSRAAGRINSSSFQGAAAGKVLFSGANARRGAATFGGLDNAQFQLRFRFLVRPKKWTEIYVPGAGWQEVTFDDGSPLYEEANLAALLPSSGVDFATAFP